MTVYALLLLVLLQVKHFLFDFLFQTSYQLANKGTYGHPGGLLHAALHGLGTLVVLAVLTVPPAWIAVIVIGECVVHYHLDWAKERIMALRAGPQDAVFWRMIGLDQMLHQLTYLAIAALVCLH